MKDFDAIKNLWQQSDPAVKNKIDAAMLIKQSASSKNKLMREKLIAAILLLITGIFIACTGFFIRLYFHSVFTYAGLAMIVLVVVLQSLFLFKGWKTLKNIDDTLPPAAHLQQWEAYYFSSKKQVKWNMPFYFIALNFAMAIYFIELFHSWSTRNVILASTVYGGWMLYAYFVLGKRSMRREEKRFKTIIDNLKEMASQLAKS